MKTCPECDDLDGNHLHKFYRFAFVMQDLEQNEIVVTVNGDNAVRSSLHISLP